MNKKLIIVGLLALLVIGLLILWLGRSDKKIAPGHLDQKDISTNVDSIHHSGAGSPNLSVPEEESIKPGPGTKASPAELMLKLALTPIVFYGKVVDEKGNPIEDATAKIGMADEKLWTGGAQHIKTTDSSGMFSVSGHGMGLNVRISKEGYYTLPESSGNFSYIKESGSLNKHPDKNDPAIFVLRRMGETVPLIRQHAKIRIRKDGTPILLSLTTGKQDSLGDIKVEAWTSDQNIQANSSRPYDWRCRISVLNGGLILKTDGEFEWEAPEGEYRQFDDINVAASDENWNSQAIRQYYIKLNDDRYGWLKFHMMSGGAHLFVIDSYLNPTPGDRNLEFDPAKQINK